LLIRGAALLIGLGALALGLTVWDFRRVVLNGALLDTENLAIVLAEQTSRSIQTVDVVLRDIQDHVVTSGVVSPEQFRERLRSREMHDFLRSRAERLPQLDSIALVGADGKRVANVLEWPAAPTDFSDRDYLQHFAALDDPELFISAPVVSRTTGAWTLYLSRRVDGPNGEFLGLVLASMPLKAFRELFNSINLRRNESIVLIRRDGSVLARNLDPPGQDRGGTSMPQGGTWHRLVAQGGGHYESPGVFDRVTRIVAVRPLRDYPLVIDVAVAKDVALAQWRREAAMTAAGTAVAAILLTLLLLALRLQFTRLQASEERLRATSRQLAICLQSMTQGLVMVDRDRRIVLCNRRAAEILGLPQSRLAARPLVDDLAELRWVADMLGAAASATADGGRLEHELRDGTIVECGCAPLVDGTGWVATCEDITARRRAERQVVFMAQHDTLTRLPNRAMFRERIQQAVEQVGRSIGAAVLCLDLDHFKAVNDTLGHPIGDRLLCGVAERLSACVRQVDAVARFGGDEFAVVQVGPERVEDVAVLAQRIIDVLSLPYELDGHRIVIGVSIGIALLPSDGTDPDTILKHADIALYRAKADGRGTFRVFEPAMDAILQERRTLELDLHRALERGEFLLLYQPEVDVASHRICGFEALVRWRHPLRGLIEPAAFVPLCEETGLIVAIGRWALRQACLDAMTWPDDIRVGVNLSAVQFASRDLVQTVSEALHESGLNPHRLDLEITETVLLERTSEVLTILQALHRLGATISMDDFGTGYSSLSYLRRFPFDKIKIDQSFIRDCTSSEDAAAIVRAVTSLGRSLGIATTAEGVETYDQIVSLEAKGCSEMQGYYFSRPVPAEELPALLQRFKVEDALLA
jgi:diguanylate cyclase (GGDEF)-like protein/PAS domain S-box-containing protein